MSAALERFWSLSAEKLRLIDAEYDDRSGSPVFTAAGKYTTRGWTEWTEGFRYGSELLQFDATGEREFLDAGIDHTRKRMARHVSHIGVHDHGFNNISTYGNLLRLVYERTPGVEPSLGETCMLALKASGAVQAARWRDIAGGAGYIYSFNGPHSLFADTIRSLRSLAVAHQLGHELVGENDRRISLLRRLLLHSAATARYICFYGTDRDRYDVRGRVAHEAIFNTVDGNFRCPNTQQGYSPFTTWTRALAWIILGYAEQLEFLDALSADAIAREAPDLPEIARNLGLDRIAGEAAWGAGGLAARGAARGGDASDAGTAANRFANPKAAAVAIMDTAARAAADYYLANSASDGIPYWDTGAPGLAQMAEWRDRPADPHNEHEPVDSSAAAIAAQGLMRLGVRDSRRARRMTEPVATPEGSRYFDAGRAILFTLLEEPYLSTSSFHQGLLLHSVYHRPNNWDYIPPGSRIPCGEASMWGDYHLREAALFYGRLVANRPYYTFFLQEDHH